MTQSDSNPTDVSANASEDSQPVERPDMPESAVENPDTVEKDSADKKDELADLVEQDSPGIVAEFVDFVLHNKRWWLTPIIIVLLLVGILVILGSSGFAPFIYTVF